MSEEYEAYLLWKISAQDQIDGFRKEIRELKAENAKLRKLCIRFAEYINQDRCEGCVLKSHCNNGDIDECWQLAEIREVAKEMGIEVIS